MSEKETTSAAPAAAPAEKQRGPITLMKGGTLPSSVEAANAAFMADTKRRWAERDAERAEAKKIGATEGAKEVATDRAIDLGQPGTSAVAIIGYYLKDSDEYQYMQADVLLATDAAGNPDETFNIVCPRCVQRGIPQTMAQLRVRNSNRKWHLDSRVKGEIFIDDDGEAYTLAGKIICHEKIRCPDPFCDGCYQIGEYPAGKEGRPGTTGMWRA